MYLEFIAKEEESSIQIIKNLESLLLNSDIETIKLGVEIIKAGGIPNQLAGCLIFILKTKESLPIRNIFKDLLDGYENLEWETLLQDPSYLKGFHQSYTSEKYIWRQLARLGARTSPDIVAKFSCVVYDKLGRGLRYALTANSNKVIKKQAYQLLLSEGRLDYSKGLNYDSVRSSEIIESDYEKKSGPPLPVLALELEPIHSLNLSNCRYNHVCEKITQFKDLKHLDLSSNSLRELPLHISQLKNLKSIDLSNNYFKKFPKILGDLPNLKRVDLRKNVCFKVPGCFLKKQPRCSVQFK